MKANELYDWIDSLTEDIVFEYQGVHGVICPSNRQNISVAYGDKTKDYTSIRDVMRDQFFNGKSLNEISGQLSFLLRFSYEKGGIVEKALRVAEKAHQGQKDKAGVNYISHPITVAAMFKMEQVQERVVALLHDVVEDSNITLEDLQNRGFDEGIIRAVAALTKDGTDYFEYLYRIKQNSLARAVKMADLTHNMDLSRIPDPTDEDYRRIEKYKKSLAYLQAD